MTQFHFIFSSDFEDIELQVLNAKDSNCDSVSSPVHGASLHSNQIDQGQTLPVLVTETSAGDGVSVTVNSDQHCDVKVDVHRKSSSASSEPAVVTIDLLELEKPSRQSVVKSTVNLFVNLF